MRGKRLFVAMAAVLVLMLVGMVSGCGESGPAAATEDFVNAVADGDCEKIIDLLSKDNVALFEEMGEDAVKGCEMSMGEDFGDSDIKIKKFEVIEETEEGNTASVEFKMTSEVDGEEQTDEETINLVKEDGEWKVVIF